MNASLTQTLAQQQQCLLDALFVRPGGDRQHEIHVQLFKQLEAPHPQTSRGLAAYRSNGHAMAERSLRAAYPVVTAMVGSDSFGLLARDLWHTHPPRCGDLARWGDALPGFLRASEQLSDAPYLSDVARAEWALHRAAGAADAEPDLPSFARLGSEDPEGLALTLGPGTTVVSSPWPVASLVTAHLHGIPSLDEAGRLLREEQGEHALVWRQGLRPCIAAVQPAAAALVQALLGGADLPHALNAACSTGGTPEAFDFSAWLTAAVTDGLVTGVHRQSASNIPHPPEPAP